MNGMELTGLINRSLQETAVEQLSAPAHWQPSPAETPHARFGAVLFSSCPISSGNVSKMNVAGVATPVRLINPLAMLQCP